MPDLRPMVATEQVLTLLNQHFRAPILDLAPLDGGQVARVFSFEKGYEMVREIIQRKLAQASI